MENSTSDVDLVSVDDLIYEYLNYKGYKSTLVSLLDESPSLKSLRTAFTRSTLANRKMNRQHPTALGDEIRRRVLSDLVSRDYFFSIVSPIRKMESAMAELSCVLQISSLSNNGKNCRITNRDYTDLNPESQPSNNNLKATGAQDESSKDVSTKKRVNNSHKRRNNRSKPRLKKISAVCDMIRWNKVVDERISCTFVADTVARAINESCTDLNRSHELDVAEVVQHIESDPCMMGAFESILDDYFRGSLDSAGTSAQVGDTPATPPIISKEAALSPVQFIPFDDLLTCDEVLPEYEDISDKSNSSVLETPVRRTLSDDHSKKRENDELGSNLVTKRLFQSTSNQNWSHNSEQEAKNALNERINHLLEPKASIVVTPERIEAVLDKLHRNRKNR